MLRQETLSRAVRALLMAAAAGVCLAQPGLPDRGAKVIVQYGRVSALGGNGEKALFLGDVVKPQMQIITGPDGYAQFQVSDGSTFEVFPNSRMVFREHVGNLQDLLNLLVGRVKVTIQHLNGVPNPNRVSSPTAVISVRGTVFDVTVEDDEGTTLVSVDEGQVDVRNLTAPGNAVFLNPGDALRVYRNQPLALRQVDKGGLARGSLRVLTDIYYRIMLGRTSGGVGSLPGGGGTTPPPGTTGNGDKGKGGSTTTAPGAPGGSTGTTTAPGAPGAPGAPPTGP